MNSALVTGRLLALTTCIAAILALVFYSRARRVYLASPFGVLLFLIFAIFGVRPLLMTESRHFDFYGTSIVRGFNTACLIGLVALLSALIGYWACHSTRIGGHRSIVVDTDAASCLRRPNTTLWNRHLAAAVLCLSIWYLLMARYGGLNFLAVLLQGRSASVDRLYSTMPVVVPALPVAAAIIAAHGRILLDRESHSGAARRIQYLVVIATCALPSLGVGNRRFIIPVLLAGVMGAWWIDWNRRVRWSWIVLGAFSFLLLATIPFIRSAGSRTDGGGLASSVASYSQREGVVGLLDNFFLSYDTEMFNYVSFLSARVGSEIPLGLGRGTIWELLQAPVPSRFLSEPVWSNVLLQYAFGGSSGCSAGGVCPVPSIVGVLWYDLGWLGISIGMLIVGGVCAYFDKSAVRASGLGLVLILAAGTSATAIWRGNSISQLWIAANIAAVAVLALWIFRLACARPEGKDLRRSAQAEPQSTGTRIGDRS